MGAAFEVIRDPLWDNVTLDPGAVRLLDTPALQRLRYVRQLGHAFLVYPGATHSRFEHALGAFHLTQRALAALESRGELEAVAPHDRRAVVLAALLHDIGHYPFSHALEEAGFPSHEAQGAARLVEPGLRQGLEAEGGPGLAAEIGALIRGRSESPLQGLISGTLDLDKIDYLCRDSRMCGVPYGTVDVDRLLASLTVVEGRDGGARSPFRGTGWHLPRSATEPRQDVRRPVGDDRLHVEVQAQLDVGGLVDREDEDPVAARVNESSTGSMLMRL